ncbi:fibronectin type III domain-containing protein, partial [Clostridioides difficile]
YVGDKLLVTVKDKTFVEIGDLKAGTKYELIIKAVDEAGNKSEAGTVSFTTKKKSSNNGGGLNGGNESNVGSLPQTGGTLPIAATSISILAITLGTVILKKKIINNSI